MTPSPEPATAELVAEARSLSLTRLPLDLRACLARCADRLEHLTQPAGGAPDGYVLVPREPTPEMLHAAELAELPHDDWMTYWSGGYSAMLSAAPTPPPRQWSEAEIERGARAAWEYTAGVNNPSLPWDGDSYEMAVWRTDKIAAFRRGLFTMTRGLETRP